MYLQTMYKCTNQLVYYIIIDLEHNLFSGDILRVVQRMHTMLYLEIYNNVFTGTFPSQLAPHGIMLHLGECAASSVVV